LHEETRLAIILLCETAGVSRAAYYKWTNRTTSAREVESVCLCVGIQLLAQQVKDIYGYRRMTITINSYRKLVKHLPINEKRIYRIMHTFSVFPHVNIHVAEKPWGN
jgi:putative transposase